MVIHGFCTIFRTVCENPKLKIIDMFWQSPLNQVEDALS